MCNLRWCYTALSESESSNFFMCIITLNISYYSCSCYIEQKLHVLH